LKVFKGDQMVVAKDYDRDIIKIGRLSSAHLCLDDEKVSRIHSVIEVGPDGALSIIDMGSVEGTFVNGKRVNKGTLTFGDEIKVGNTTIKVEKSGGGDSVAPSVAPVAAGAVTDPNAPITDVPTAIVPNMVQMAQAVSPAAAPAPAPVAAAPAPAPVAAAPAPVAQAPAPVAYAPAPVQAEAPAVVNEQTGQPVRARPRVREGSGPLGTEMRFMWGDQMVASHFIQPGAEKAFTIGSAPKCDFACSDSKLGGPSFVLVQSGKAGSTVRFAGKMKGELHRKRGEEVMTLAEAKEKNIASSDGDGYAITIQGDDFIWVDVGGVVAEIFCQPAPKPVFVPFAETIDFTALNIFLIAFFLGAVFVITAINHSLEGDDFADELDANQSRIAKLLIKPPEVQKQLAKMEKKKDSGEVAQKHKNDEGQAGKKDAPKRSAHMAPKGDPNNKDQARMLVAKVFGNTGAGISTIFGHQGLGGELKSAMGNMFGAAPGDAQGFGGLGLRGSGSGGGGVGDTIGIGGIGTRGRGGGTGGYGSGVGVLGGKKDVDIGITSAEPTVMGSLDKELIRQVIHRNRGQIRYCYESELTSHPNLKGKVAIKFVISASGSVAQATVAQSDVHDAELETCVAGRVHTWMFPKPKGGGVVIVTYPFVFNQGGK
jgi:hypothetical protein